MTAPRYLYIGSEVSWGTCEARRRALIRLGREVVAVGYESSLSKEKSLLARFELRTALGPGVWRLNSAILRVAYSMRPQIIWVDKGIFVWPHTLEQMRERTGALLVHYNTDDLQNPRNFWRNFRGTISLYDVHITTNIPNVSELPAMGARSVIQSHLGYDDELFRPLELNQEDRLRLGADVSFTGHWEPATEAMIEHALQRGLPSRIRGHNWHKAKSPKVRPICGDGPLYGVDYVKAICASKINLGIVSVWNRNQTAGRTFEIPACRGFLLAPRTDEVARFYQEGVEAEFFGDACEMVDKAEFYLKNEPRRQRIAEAGHRRCVASRYSWADRMTSLIHHVERMLT